MSSITTRNGSENMGSYLDLFGRTNSRNQEAQGFVYRTSLLIMSVPTGMLAMAVSQVRPFAFLEGEQELQ